LKIQFHCTHTLLKLAWYCLGTRNRHNKATWSGKPGSRGCCTDVPCRSRAAMHNSNPVPTTILTPSLFDPSGANQGPQRTKKSLLSLASFPCFFFSPAIWFSSSNLPWNQSPRNHKGLLRLLLLRVLLLLFFVKVFLIFSVVFSFCSSSCRDEGRCSVRPWTRRAPLAWLRLCLRGCRWQLVPRLHGGVSLGSSRSDRLCYPAALLWDARWHGGVRLTGDSFTHCCSYSGDDTRTYDLQILYDTWHVASSN
jgi:hypothetical protein